MRTTRSARFRWRPRHQPDKPTSDRIVIAGPMLLPPRGCRNRSHRDHASQQTKSRPIGRHALRISCAFLIKFFALDWVPPAFSLTTARENWLPATGYLPPPHKLFHAAEVHVSEVNDVAPLFDPLDRILQRPTLCPEHRQRHHRRPVDSRSTMNENFSFGLFERFQCEIHALAK